MFKGAGLFADRLAGFLAVAGPDGPVGELASFLRLKGRRPLCLPSAEEGEGELG